MDWRALRPPMFSHFSHRAFWQLVAAIVTAECIFGLVKFLLGLLLIQPS